MSETANQILKNNGLKDINVMPLDGGRFRVSMPDAGGKTKFQDMSGEQFEKLYKEKLNPAAAALYQLAQQANKNTTKAPGIVGGASAGQGVQGWESLSLKEQRSMYTEERKFLADNDPDFLSLSAEEQDGRVRQRLQNFFNAPGLSGAPAQPMVLHDKTLGKPVQPMQGQPADSSNGATAPRQDLPPTHQVQKGAPLPEPGRETPQQLVERTEQDNYLGMNPLNQNAASPAPQTRHMPPGMIDVGTGVPDPEPHHIPPERRAVPSSKPPSREELFQKWQTRKPANEKEQAARQDEEELLRMMGERTNPEKLIRAVEKKFPHHKRKLMSPEFKELYESYTKGFQYDPSMG